MKYQDRRVETCAVHDFPVSWACPSCLRSTATDLRRRIVDEARKMVGTRWFHMGRGDTGFDCLGVASESRVRAGARVPATPRYPRSLDGFSIDEVSSLIREELGLEVSEDLESVKVGDSIVLEVRRGFPHFCVLTGDGTVVVASRRGVVERRVSELLASRARFFVGVGDE